MSEDACVRCRFFQPHNDDGVCRRFPPVRHEAAEHVGFPLCRPDGWCGEFKPQGA
jgi:hypothetical protein